MTNLDQHVTSATVTYNPQREDVTVFNKQREHTLVIDNEYSTGMVWGNSALETYRAMAYHVLKLASHYGAEHKWAIEAAQSFARITISLHQWGELQISRDGELSLFCRTHDAHPIVFGIIFHGIHNKCVVDECVWYLGNAPYHYHNRDEVKVPLHKHQWLYPPDAPVPGTWSFHS